MHGWEEKVAIFNALCDITGKAIYQNDMHTYFKTLHILDYFTVLQYKVFDTILINTYKYGKNKRIVENKNYQPPCALSSNVD